MSVIHVKSGTDALQEGTLQNPFSTINQAAQIARPGDTVVVHSGVYRESVDPKYSGLSENERIVYCAAEGEDRPIIKGSEHITGWVELADHPNVWQVDIDNALFWDFNPFARIIEGDWLEKPKRGVEPDKHLGDVYLNGVSGFEVTCVEATFDPRRIDEREDFALKITVPMPHSERTTYVWHAEVKKEFTRITANFQGLNPNDELVEISVRKTCFFPSRNHVNYVTVRGFEMAQATGDWAPPTSEQVGLIGPNWSYGWIIEDNVLHDVKFSAVSLGKEISTGDNESWHTERKSGYQYQLEAVFKAKRIGWDKGKIGSHIVRNNHIYECGQNAIVGHMGSAYSRIEHNHIHNIADKHEFFGWEVAGIKFHAAIDTVIVGNNIHDCSLGMWLDWQTQGVQISRNVFHHNVRDLMIEVSHGPYVVDNNIFASSIMFQNWAQGAAFVNNFIVGSIEPHTVPDRSTPYHFPHSTDVAGCAVVSGGDERYMNNIFAPNKTATPAVGEYGLLSMRDYPRDFEEYIERFHNMWLDPSQGGGERNPLQPIFAQGNIYGDGSLGLSDESVSTDGARVGEIVSDIVEKDDGFHLVCTIPQAVLEHVPQTVTSQILGVPRIVEQRYEDPEGKDYIFDTDMLGRRYEQGRIAGPIGHLIAGSNDIVVWR